VPFFASVFEDMLEIALEISRCTFHFRGFRLYATFEKSIGPAAALRSQFKAKHIPGDSDWYSRPYMFFILRKKYSKSYTG
jgi:hypothetical protein